MNYLDLTILKGEKADRFEKDAKRLAGLSIILAIGKLLAVLG